MEYEMSDLIKKVEPLRWGASAVAINMSAKWLCSRNFGYKVEISSFYDGIGLDDFSVLSHFDLENNIALVQGELSPLSEEMNMLWLN